MAIIIVYLGILSLFLSGLWLRSHALMFPFTLSLDKAINEFPPRAKIKLSEYHIQGVLIKLIMIMIFPSLSRPTLCCSLQLAVNVERNTRGSDVFYDVCLGILKCFFFLNCTSQHYTEAAHINRMRLTNQTSHLFVQSIDLQFDLTSWIFL